MIHLLQSATMNETYQVEKSSQPLRLDAMQGSSEERVKRRNTTVSERQRITDAAERQELAQRNWLSQLAGASGGGL